MDRSPPVSSVHGISQAGMAFFPSGDFSNTEVELASPALGEWSLSHWATREVPAIESSIKRARNK